MNMMLLNAESLTKQLNQEVPELYVVIAKNDAAGLPASGIGEILGVPTGEVEEIQRTELYRDIRLLLGAERASMAVGTESSWDALENFALTNLVKKAPHIRDTDELLRIAAVANKAQRRLTPKDIPLDPSAGNARVPLKLTRRIMERINADGSQEREETQQISLLNGSAKNPSFQDIDSLLGVSTRPRIQEKIMTPQNDFTLDDVKFGGE